MVRFSARKTEAFSCSPASILTLGLTQNHTQLSRGKQPGRETNHSHHSNAKVTKAWSYTVIYTEAVILIKQSDNITSFFTDTGTRTITINNEYNINLPQY
jgi:hypothetical protein